MSESLQIVVFWMSGKVWIANLSQMKPSIETEAVSGDLDSSRTSKEAALGGDATAATLATIEAVGNVPAIQLLFK